MVVFISIISLACKDMNLTKTAPEDYVGSGRGSG